MVMTTRKPMRSTDGYYEKHSHSYQGSKYSSRYEYSSKSVTNGYRSVSPELDSPRARDRERDRDRYQSLHYHQKRDRDYKKDKYSDKRGREREPDHRNNHHSSRRSKRSSSKRDGSSSNSDDRERENERGGERDRERERERSDRDRERERDRGERDASGQMTENITRVGDWSQHSSSSGIKFYYNWKTKESSWEKPKEWLCKEKQLAKKVHRDYRHRETRERERGKEHDDRYFSSRGYYGKHSRGDSRVGWTHEPDAATSVSTHHRRRHDDEMDISPGSTPTSEASYSHTPTVTAKNNSNINSINSSSNNTTTSSQANENSNYSANALPRILSSSTNNSSSSTPTSHGVSGSVVASTSAGHHMHPHHHQTAAVASSSASSHYSVNSVVTPTNSSNSNSNQLVNKFCASGGLMGASASPPSYPHSLHHHQQTAPQMNSNLNSNVPGPSANGSTSSILVMGGAGLPKILSHTLTTKQLDQMDPRAQYLMNHHRGFGDTGQSVSVPQSSNSTTLAQQTLLRSDSYPSVVPVSIQPNSSDGPPTPTQEKDLMDMMDMNHDHRKLETASTSLLHSVMASQGPNLTPTLQIYYRPELIKHISDWGVERLERDIQKCSEEIHVYDIQCSQVSADLKCARSIVRTREIKTTLNEQKIMFLRQQIRRIEQSLSQNPYMSESNDL